MSEYTIALIVMAGFLVILFLGIPVAVGLILGGFVGLVCITGLEGALTILARMPFATIAGHFMIPIMLFILMGNLALGSGIGEELFNAGYKWLGSLPGGLALATMAACTGFAGCTGSSTAATATMGVMAFPQMERYNYSRRLSCACVSVGGTLGVLIPPSIIFIIYGVLTETSIGSLFIAGIIPGLMLSGMFLVMIVIMCRRNPNLGPPGASSSLREKIASLSGIWAMLVIFILVIGGLYLGVFSPSEAGAAGAFGTFVIALFRRRLKLSIFISCAKDSIRIGGFLGTILIGAMVFCSFLGLSGFGIWFAELITSLQFPRFLLMLTIIVMYIPLGMFFDMISVTVITVPIVSPVLQALGFDLIWFGVVFVILVEMAMVTPPIGFNVFTAEAVTKVPAAEIFRGIWPFFFCMLVGVAILIAFPQIALFLPSLMY